MSQDGDPAEFPDSPELRRLRTMILIRQFEERVVQIYCKPGQRIGGFAHICTGQEALPVGVAEIFRHGLDTYAGAFRCHGWSIALGMTPRAAMAELFGKAAGCCRGRGGSMHFRDAHTDNMGGWATVGGQMPVGAGAAFAARYRGTGGVAFIAFGDGTLAQGVCAETLNLASLLKLPAVFLLEDNGIALGTKVPRHSAEPDLARRAHGFGVPVLSLDGNDVDDVIRATGEAADRARRGDGPTFCVARTFRFRGWSMSDPMRYRTKQEMLDAKARDPITTYAARLTANGILNADLLDALEDDAAQRVKHAEEFADTAPNPPLEDRLADLLAEQYPYRPEA